MRWCLPVLSVLIAAPLAWAEPPQKPAPRKPNILFLFADDMRADTVAALGNPVARTPNLDALVAGGFAMTNAYCFGGNAYFRWKDFVPPGRPNTPKGLLAPGDGPNFPLSLKGAGYLTYHHGKRGNTAPLIQAKPPASCR